MSKEKILQGIIENLDAVIKRDSPLSHSLWKELLSLHPADIAEFITDLDRESGMKLFVALPKKIRNEVFQDFSDPVKAESLKALGEAEKVDALRSLSVDELTDLFDYFSDEELKKHLNLLHKKEREKVLSLLKFHPESAGGIMEIDVLSFMEDFTVEKSIKILQRMRPKLEIHREIYVTDDEHRLVGHIFLEDLVLQPPKARISSFMRKNELIAQADEDREAITNKMVHYGLMTVPVVGKDSYFLGVIPSETLVDVIVKEASEDAQKMAALAPMKRSYYDTPFLSILYKRSPILIALLLAESVSTTILESYEHSLPVFFTFFIPMLVSTGGNASHQTSTLVIQGMATGDIHKGNILRFLRKEFMVGIFLALILGSTAFLRAYFSTKNIAASLVIGFTLGTISFTAVVLGSFIPLALKRLNIDPAFSAGPFLATLLDILGTLIYCIFISYAYISLLKIFV